MIRAERHKRPESLGLAPGGGVGASVLSRLFKLDVSLKSVEQYVLYTQAGGQPGAERHGRAESLGLAPGGSVCGGRERAGGGAGAFGPAASVLDQHLHLQHADRGARP